MASKVFIYLAVLSMAAANKYDFKMREAYDDIEQSDESCVLSGRSSYKPPPPATYEESTGDVRHPHDNRTRESREHHRKNITYELSRGHHRKNITYELSRGHHRKNITYELSRGHDRKNITYELSRGHHRKNITYGLSRGHHRKNITYELSRGHHRKNITYELSRGHHRKNITYGLSRGHHRRNITYELSRGHHRKNITYELSRGLHRRNITYELSRGHHRKNITYELSRGHHRKNITYGLRRFGNFRRDGDKTPSTTATPAPAPVATAPATTRPICEGLFDKLVKNCETIKYEDPTGEGTAPGPLNSIKGTTELRFWTTKIFKLTRTTPFRLSFNVECDYLAYYCMKAYQTGRLCARTFYYIYHTFINYCMLDYVNCREKHEVWQVIHMGDCFTVKPLASYNQYPYHNDYFLDQYYIVDENTLLMT